MQAKKKLKKKAAVKSTPAKSKKEKQAKEEQQNEKQPFLKTLIFGEEKPNLTKLEAGSTTILDILSPTTVDTKSRDYIVVDGVFHTYLYVTGYGYTTTVGSCWLAPLVAAGEGVNMSFLVKRQSKEKILSKISQTTMVNRSRMRDVGDTRQDYEELDSAISSGLYLKDVMNRQGEDFYYMHTLIEVTASDTETLEQRVTEVEKLCVSVDMIARRCDYKNEQAFLSSLPILALDPDIERKARRNALTSGVAAAFPFASYELSDHNGIFLGLNLYNRSPVFLDPYDDYKYTNGNWWIGGSTGAGKTVTLQCLGGRLRQQGKRVIIIAPKERPGSNPLPGFSYLECQVFPVLSCVSVRLPPFWAEYASAKSSNVLPVYPASDKSLQSLQQVLPYAVGPYSRSASSRCASAFSLKKLLAAPFSRSPMNVSHSS